MYQFKILCLYLLSIMSMTRNYHQLSNGVTTTCVCAVWYVSNLNLVQCMISSSGQSVQTMPAVIKQESINCKCMTYFVRPLSLHYKIHKKNKNTFCVVLQLVMSLGTKNLEFILKWNGKAPSSFFPILNSRVICYLKFESSK